MLVFVFFRWALIASWLPGRTAIQVKNFWNRRGKKISEGGIGNIDGGANGNEVVPELSPNPSRHGLLPPPPTTSLTPTIVSTPEPYSPAYPFPFPLPSANFQGEFDYAFVTSTSTAMPDVDEFLSTYEVWHDLPLPFQTPSSNPFSASVPESSHTNEEIDLDIATFDSNELDLPDFSGHGLPLQRIFYLD